MNQDQQRIEDFSRNPVDMFRSEQLVPIRFGSMTQVAPQVIRSFESDHALTLPLPYARLVAATDGIELDNGFYRFFGITPTSHVPLGSWNHPDLWSFAWENANEYWYIAEDCFGVQYGYSRLELTVDPDPPIYRLDGRDDWTKPFFRNLHELCIGLLRLARFNDQEKLQIKTRFPKIPSSHHLLSLLPSSLLFANQQDLVHSLQLFPRAVSMIIQGQLWTQLKQLPIDAHILKISQLKDEFGRPKILVDWRRS